MVNHSKIANDYARMAEAMIIFNKYVNYERTTALMELDDGYIYAGIDKKYYIKADIDRLEVLGWEYSGGNGCWKYC